MIENPKYLILDRKNSLQKSSILKNLIQTQASLNQDLLLLKKLSNQLILRMSDRGYSLITNMKGSD